MLRGKAVGTVPKPQVARKKGPGKGALQGALKWPPLSAFRLFLVFYPEPGLLNRKKKLLKTSPVGVEAELAAGAPTGPSPHPPDTPDSRRDLVSREPDPPRSRARSPALLSPRPGSRWGSWPGQQHERQRKRPQRAQQRSSRAWSPAPDAAEGTQAPRPASACGLAVGAGAAGRRGSSVRITARGRARGRP